MVEKRDGQIFMVSSKAEILETFLFKAEKFYKHSFRYKRFRKVMVFNSEGDAAKCMRDLQDADGIVLSRQGNRINIEIPKKLVERIE